MLILMARAPRILEHTKLCRNDALALFRVYNIILRTGRRIYLRK